MMMPITCVLGASNFIFTGVGCPRSARAGVVHQVFAFRDAGIVAVELDLVVGADRRPPWRSFQTWNVAAGSPGLAGQLTVCVSFSARP